MQASPGAPTIAGGERRTYRLIQVLRAVAALLVVDSHALEMLEAHRGGHGAFWINGAAGVDLFFVISGLVMTLSSEGLRQRAHPAIAFLRARFERIAPMYWLATTVKVVAVLAFPSLAAHALHSVWHVVASYLFLPSHATTGEVYPVLVVGWTLQLEMLFYVLFALALAFRLRALVVLAPALLMLYGIGWYLSLTGPGSAAERYAVAAWADPVVLEFFYGVVLGRLVLRGLTLAPRASILLTAAGIVLLLLVDPGAEIVRPFSWGLPALAVVAGAIGLEPALRERLPRFLLKLGDASYSIYLVHGLVLPSLALALFRGASVDAPWMKLLVVTGSVLLSAVAGVIVYRTVEVPLTAKVKGWRTRRI